MCRGFNPLCSLSDEYRDQLLLLSEKTPKKLVLISVRCQTLKYNCLVTQWMHMSEILHFTLVFIFSGDEQVKHYYCSYLWKLIWISPWCKILNSSACTIYVHSSANVKIQLEDFHQKNHWRTCGFCSCKHFITSSVVRLEVEVCLCDYPASCSLAHPGI